MTQIKDNQHFWTWLPELGENYSYCERCDKVMVNATGETMSYKKAIEMIAKQNQDKREE